MFVISLFALTCCFVHLATGRPCQDTETCIVEVQNKVNQLEIYLKDQLVGINGALLNLKAASLKNTNCVNGRCFSAETTTHVSWDEAEKACLRLGGHLASIHTAQEQALVAKLCGYEKCWIGLNDLALEGHFEWTDGTSMNYTWWNHGEPNNFDGNENCVYGNGIDGGKWYDHACKTNLPYICAAPQQSSPQTS